MQPIPEWPALNPWTRPIRLRSGQLRLVSASRTKIDLSPGDSVDVSVACELLAHRWPLVKIRDVKNAHRGVLLLAKLGQLVDARVLRRYAGSEDEPTLGRALMQSAIRAESQAKQPIAAPDPLPPSVGVLAPGQWQPVLSGALHSAGINRVAALANQRSDDPRSCPDLEGISLVIVVGELDWTLITEFMENGLAHLLITPSAATAEIGPLVSPGRSPCLRCVHLAKSEIDPFWPTTTEVIRDRPQPPVDPMLARAAAQISAALTHAWMTNRTTASSVVLRTFAPYGETSIARVKMHPLCGCLRELDPVQSPVSESGGRAA